MQKCIDGNFRRVSPTAAYIYKWLACRVCRDEGIFDRNRSISILILRQSMEGPTLRWGIASAGKISHDFATALRNALAKDHEIIAVAAQELSRAQDFAKLHKIKKAYEGYDKLALDKDIDIVYIGAINPYHFEIAMLMLKHNKHVLCEKPLTMNLKQATKLIDYARSKKLLLMEAVWSRFFPVYDCIRKELASGNIGDVQHVTVSFGFEIYNVDRVAKKELGGGSILDLGIYCLQFACLAFNNEIPEKICASGTLNENGVDISMKATLYYKGDRTATIMTNAMATLLNHGYICGTKGSINVPQFWCPEEVYLPRGRMSFPPPDLAENEKMNFINSIGLCYEASAAREYILKGLIESPLMTHDTSLLLAKLEDEIRKQLHVVYSQDA